MTENELQHHGILGMKWGIRRYQNEDGSLTAAGRKRYGAEAKGDQPASSGESSNTQTQTQNPAPQQTQSTASTSPRPASEMTTKELQDFLMRVDLERRYNQIVNPPRPKEEKKQSPVMKFISDVLYNAGKQVATKWVQDVLTNIVYRKQNKEKEQKDKENKEQEDKKNKDQKDNANKRFDSIEATLKDLQNQIKQQSAPAASSTSSNTSEKTDKKNKNKNKDSSTSSSSDWIDDWLKNEHRRIDNWTNSESNWIDDWLKRESASIWK